MDYDLVGFFAVRWTKTGYPLGNHYAWKELLEEYYQKPIRSIYRIDRDDALRDELYAAVKALDELELLPRVPRDHVRVHHNFGLKSENGEREAILRDILEFGLVPQPEGSGEYSESPSEVFVVVDDPNKTADDHRRYNRYFPWVTADLPLAVYRSLVGSQPGWIVTVNAIPYQYIVAVNGLPIRDFVAARRRWL